MKHNTLGKLTLAQSSPLVWPCVRSRVVCGVFHGSYSPPDQMNQCCKKCHFSKITINASQGIIYSLFNDDIFHTNTIKFLLTGGTSVTASRQRKNTQVLITETMKTGLEILTKHNNIYLSLYTHAFIYTYMYVCTFGFSIIVSIDFLLIS